MLLRIQIKLLTAEADQLFIFRQNLADVSAIKTDIVAQVRPITITFISGHESKTQDGNCRTQK